MRSRPAPLADEVPAAPARPAPSKPRRHQLPVARRWPGWAIGAWQAGILLAILGLWEAGVAGGVAPVQREPDLPERLPVDLQRSQPLRDHRDALDLAARRGHCAPARRPQRRGPQPVRLHTGRQRGG